MVAGQPARLMIWVCFPHDAEASTSLKIFHRFSHRWDFIPAIFPFPCPCWLAYRWRSGSIVASQLIDIGSIPVRCRSYNIDRKFAVIFVTKVCTAMLFSFFLLGVEEHHWCRGSIIALQAIDMCSIPVWCRNRSLVKVSQENLASEGLDIIVFQPVRVWIDQHRWCSCSILDFQAIDMGSFPVRCKSYNIDRNFALIFVTKENTTHLFSFFHDGIHEHQWCSRNIADFQDIDMSSIPVRRKKPNSIRTFSVNHAPEGFKHIVLSTVRV